MPDSGQLQRLKKVVDSLESGLSSSIKALQKNLGALTAGGGIGVPPKPKRELIKALQRLRKALNSALLSLEHKIGGSKGKGSTKRKKKASAA